LTSARDQAAAVQLTVAVFGSHVQRVPPRRLSCRGQWRRNQLASAPLDQGDGSSSRVPSEDRCGRASKIITGGRLYHGSAGPRATSRAMHWPVAANASKCNHITEPCTDTSVPLRAVRIGAPRSSPFSSARAPQFHSAKIIGLAVPFGVHACRREETRNASMGTR